MSLRKQVGELEIRVKSLAKWFGTTQGMVENWLNHEETAPTYFARLIELLGSSKKAKKKFFEQMKEIE